MRGGVHWRRGLGGGLPVGDARLPDPSSIPGKCPAFVDRSAGRIFTDGLRSGVALWKDSGALAPLIGAMSIGTPMGIVHRPDGSSCQPPAWGTDALIQGGARALVTVGPVLLALYWIFGGKRR